MPLQVSLMEESDIPAFVEVDAAGMAHWGFARAMQPDPVKRREFVEEWTRKEFKQDDTIAWVKVTDSDREDEMVAAALWRFKLAEGQPGPRPSLTAATAGPPPEDEETKRQQRLDADVGAIGKEFRDQFVGPSPHAYLNILVTHPAHQRRGAGSLLVDWGCKRADQRGIIGVLMASAAALSVYQKHGFEVVFERQLDLRPYGIHDTELRRGMIRKARPISQS